MKTRPPRGRMLGAALLAIALSSMGCRFGFQVIGRNFGRLATGAAKVAHKTTDPRRADARLSVLWVGHATTLVQIDDRFVMTDPNFTDAVAEVSPRLVEPGIDAENVPALTAIVISHMHFDHLSYGSLSLLENKTKTLLVPPAVLEILPRYSFETREVDTWSSIERDGVRFTAVPVDHVGGRWGLDQSWRPKGFTGWVFQRDGLTVYFGGDTAYDKESFQRARAKFPRIDLALLPICPLEPREFMKHTHMSPSEALAAMDDLGARAMVPIHFDTFVNSYDRPGDCGRALDRAVVERGVEPSRVVRLSIGEQRVIVAKPPRVEQWFR